MEFITGIIRVNGRSVEVERDMRRVVRYFDESGALITKMVFRDWRGRTFVQESDGAYHRISLADERIRIVGRAPETDVPLPRIA
ncbi:hypothetical protein [Hugonella massiliensis]|uniref:hypothetical protein n=1 Tax=Hugonella massiliensis TaxID=1720315 RepID=UPI00073F18F8|nr:hypothetical protein [Hugonella massiliensis]MDD6729909.1 hypothetical protein [Eggerthellaceae bacterium]